MGACVDATSTPSEQSWQPMTIAGPNTAHRRRYWLAARSGRSGEEVGVDAADADKGDV
jgi:hypothetical protein